MKKMKTILQSLSQHTYLVNWKKRVFFFYHAEQKTNYLTSCLGQTSGKILCSMSTALST